MKKILLFLSLTALIFSSCQNKNSFTVEGNLKETTFNGKTIFLQKMDSVQSVNGPVVVDSVVIKDSIFIFKGTIEEPTFGFVSIGRLENPEENTPVGNFILEPGKIKITFDKIAVSVEGTPGNDGYNKVLQGMNKIATLYQEVSAAGGPYNVPLDKDGYDAETRMMNLQEEVSKSGFDFLKENIKNKAGEFFFYSSYDSFSKEQLVELINLTDSTFRNRPEIVRLEEILNRAAPTVGQPFVDVEMVNTKGEQMKLSDYVSENKCVLFDFWASWCRPCIEEMPHLKKIYSTYKGKGFEIVGISVDDDRKAWLDAISKYNMNWIQLGDDRRLASEMYEIKTIPHTVLVDQNGIVVAKDLRGQELEDKIAEILK